mgnify:FL=1
MKPSVPERGIVIAVDGSMAKVMITGSEACRGCGQAKIGLCRSAGLNMVVIAKNVPGAKSGDMVIVGIDEKIRLRGYIFAFIIPLISLLAGTSIGLITSFYLSIKGLEVLSGFLGLAIGSYLSLKRLRRLDKEESLIIKSILNTT